MTGTTSQDVPRITDLAQVDGRNALNLEEKFDLDVWYIEHVSDWLHIKIIFRTIETVLLGRGGSASDSQRCQGCA